MKRGAFAAAVGLAAACIALAAFDAAAQGYPGGGGRRGGMGGDSSLQRKPKEDTPKKEAATDPMAALEHELPSLKVDIQLTAAQVAAWNAFERDVRDVAELERVQRRHVMSVQASEGAPKASRLLNGMADDEKMKADTFGDLQRHFEALYALLDDKQKALMDQRVVLAIREPLGQ